MLNKTQISQISIGSPEWFAARLGKFTSSSIHELMGMGFIKYVRLKVGEHITGKSCEREVDVDAVRHGIMYEYGGLLEFGRQMAVDFLIHQVLIAEPDGRFSCTPDGLIVVRESPDGSQYEVEPIEVKCPYTYDNYLALYECETAMDLKDERKQYYWQVLDQMDNCGAIKGHFVAYQPDFKVGGLKHIVVDTAYSFVNKKGTKEFPIFNDLQLLRQKKKEAVAKFDQLVEKLNEHV